MGWIKVAKDSDWPPHPEVPKTSLQRWTGYKKTKDNLNLNKERRGYGYTWIYQIAIEDLGFTVHRVGTTSSLIFSTTVAVDTCVVDVDS